MVAINLGIYVIEIFFYYIRSINLTRVNLKKFNLVEMTINLSSISIGFWGFVLIFNSKELREPDHEVAYLISLVVWMCAIRVMLAAIITFLLVCYLIVFCCLLAMGRYQRNFRHTEHLSRLPLVNTFL